MRLRRGTVDDVPFLGVMMREAGFHPARLPPLDEALRAPHVAQWIEGWGRDGDLAIIAEDDDGTRLGAAWCRRFESSWTHGFLDVATPVVAIAVDGAYRARGIGTRLLAALAEGAHEAGAGALSLAVGRTNPALRLYERVGFARVGVLAIANDPAAQLVLRRTL